MSQELEVHFCNICNASIPESALREGKAVRVEGHTVPTVSAAAPAGEPRREAASSGGAGGILAAALVILLGVAATAIFLDWRLGQEVQGIDRRLGLLAERLEVQSDQVAGLRERMRATLVAADLAPVEQRVAAFAEALGDSETRFQQALERRFESLEGLPDLVRSIGEAETQGAARLALLHDELRALGRDVAEIKAEPRIVPSATAPLVPPDTAPPPEAASDTGLPAEIAHWVTQLADADEGTRFEAVHALVTSGDERVYPHVLPLAKDPDPFVRRLVLEAVADYRTPESVDALITALADAESIVRHSAYSSLRKLTGEDLPFDPDAGGEQRSAMQKRWKTWWEKHRDTF